MYVNIDGKIAFINFIVTALEGDARNVRTVSADAEAALAAAHLLLADGYPVEILLFRAEDAPGLGADPGGNYLVAHRWEHVYEVRKYVGVADITALLDL